MPTKPCYFPNGSPTDLVACNTTSEHSGCCGVGSSCMGEGLCLTNSTLLYRGACTDISWQSASCPRVCHSDSPESPNYGPADGVQFISSCFDYDSDYLQPPWACGRNASCDADKLFYLPLLSYPSKTNLTSDSTSGAETSNTPGLPTATVPITASPLTKASSNGHTATVGGAVGALLGFAFLVTLGWALYERRKRRKLATQLGGAHLRKPVIGDPDHQHAHGQSRAVEMAGNPKERHELPEQRPQGSDGLLS